jgi:polyvinyl alcohol dehydrogenase (cytochrome)
MMGIDANTGELRWITQVHPHPAGIITGSPVLAGGKIYIGISSRESS